VDPSSHSFGDSGRRVRACVDHGRDVLAQPPGELGLFVDVPGLPAGPGLNTPSAQVIGAVEHEVVNLSDPRAAGQIFEVLRDERPEQQGRQPVLGDAVRDVQPRVAKRRPVDLAVSGGPAERVDEPVDIEDSALGSTPPQAGQRAIPPLGVMRCGSSHAWQ
jgi:hypothetical protein